MIGDKLVIKEYHTKIAKKIVAQLNLKHKNKFIISVSGESGSGKSETAHEIAKHLKEQGYNPLLLSQDDYFVFPPKTNQQMRKNNIHQVGMYEVKLDLLDANLFSFKNECPKIYKPIINFNEDKIDHEIVDTKDVDIIIAEGTYTGFLQFVDVRIFIDKTYHDTREHRKERARETQDEFLEKILEIEHRIIQKLKNKADIIIKKDFSDIIIQKQYFTKS